VAEPCAFLWDGGARPMRHILVDYAAGTPRGQAGGGAPTRLYLNEAAMVTAERAAEVVASMMR